MQLRKLILHVYEKAQQLCEKYREYAHGAYLIYVGVRLSSITAKINDSLPTRKPASSYPVFIFLWIRIDSLRSVSALDKLLRPHCHSFWRSYECLSTRKPHFSNQIPSYRLLTFVCCYRERNSQDRACDQISADDLPWSKRTHNCEWRGDFAHHRNDNSRLQRSMDTVI
jgi:hypothetical protein